MSPKQKHLFGAVLTAATIVLILVFNFRLNTPPEVVESNAPDSLFSADRAAWHLQQIASERNFIGSPANERVREYIADQLRFLGLEPDIQHLEYYEPRLQRAAMLGNVLARIPGSGNGKAIMFIGHYDTVIDAYGASDNGAAVVAMLELARAIQYYPALEHDLILFFSDGEEVGLLGAQAFLESHPWAADVAVVINLEARGTSGQSFMFETGDNNLEMIRAFAKAVPHPIASSLSYEIYSRMPNDTDFSPFRQRGYQGLNFAFIDNGFDYHTGGDNIENTDLRSIQHHGSYALALALYLGNHDLNLQSDQDAVYFNTIGSGFAHYPYSRVPALTILSILMCILAVTYGFYRGKIHPLKLLYGLLAFSIYLALLYVIFDSLHAFIASFYRGSDYRLLEYHHKGILLGVSLLAAAFTLGYFRMLLCGTRVWQLVVYFGICFALLWLTSSMTWWKLAAGIALAAWLYFAHKRGSTVWNLSSGALVFWAVLTAYVSFTIKGGSYLFTWPFIFSIVPLIIGFALKRGRDIGFKSGLTFMVFSIPVLLWFSMIFYLFQVAMGLSQLGVSMFIPGLMAGLLIPHIHVMSRIRPWILAGVFLLAGLVVLLLNTTGLEYDQRYRKSNNIIFASHQMSGQTYWISLDDHIDDWTVQFLTSNPDTIEMGTFFPLGSDKVLASPTHWPSMPLPEARVISDTVIDGERKLTVNFTPNRPVTRMAFHIDTENEALDIRTGHLGRYPLSNFRQSRWKLYTYFAPPDEGVMITFYTKPEHEIAIHLNTHDDTGIPPFPGYRERPSFMMSRGDQSVVSSIFLF